jgi:hypothetical protein
LTPNPHPGAAPDIETVGEWKPMNPLRFLVRAFVNTFGITQPPPRQEAAAGRFIGIMLLGVLVILAVAVWLLRGVFTH